jgi:Holliday junction resolvase RusA-like endonuclease
VNEEWGLHIIKIQVLGEPKGCPRPRFTRNGHTYKPGTDKQWRDALAWQLKPKAPDSPLEGPLRLMLRFYFPRPKYHAKMEELPHYKTSKPDADNLAKTVMDAMTSAGYWKDDNQVAVLRVCKFYSDTPRCDIELDQPEEK